MRIRSGNCRSCRLIVALAFCCTGVWAAAARAATVMNVKDPPNTAVGDCVVDDTANIQIHIDALADAGGGVLDIPPGCYKVDGLRMSCGKKGSSPACSRSYNGIWLRGAGRDITILKNTNVNTDRSVLMLGDLAEIPGLVPNNDRLSNIIISGITFSQVPTASTEAKVVSSYATQDVEIYQSTFTGSSNECLVMGGGAKSIRWFVHDNVAHRCGHGTAPNWRATSALNLNGEDVVATNNYVFDSGQGIETGARRARFINNTLVGSPLSVSAPVSPSTGINIGSTGSGVWDIEVSGNSIRDWENQAIQIENSIGTLNRIYVHDNVMYGSGIALGGGTDRNSVLEGALDTVIHGTSVVKGNTIIRPDNSAIMIGAWSAPERSLESWSIDDNTIIYEDMHCEGNDAESCISGALDEAGKCDDPNKNCVLYTAVAVVGPYGGRRRSGWEQPIVIRNEPRASISNLRIVGPTYASGMEEDTRGYVMLDFQQESSRNRVVVNSMTATFPWRIRGDPNTTDEDWIPPNTKYSDVNRFYSAIPAKGSFDAGTVITNLTAATPTRGWLVTQSGFGSTSPNSAVFTPMCTDCDE